MHACTLVLVHPFIVSAVQTETFTAATLCYYIPSTKMLPT